MGLFDWLSGKKSKVEKEVEKPLEVERQVEKPLEVERQVEKPLEVERQVEEPVRKPSEEVKLLWSYEAGGFVLSVAIGDGYVAAGSWDKKVYLFDCSGKLLGTLRLAKLVL